MGYKFSCILLGGERLFESSSERARHVSDNKDSFVTENTPRECSVADDVPAFDSARLGTGQHGSSGGIDLSDIGECRPPRWIAPAAPLSVQIGERPDPEIHRHHRPPRVRYRVYCRRRNGVGGAGEHAHYSIWRAGGRFVGASGDISAGLGVGANLLVGGTRKSVSLQPLSVEGQVGVNLALGVARMKLKPIN